MKQTNNSKGIIGRLGKPKEIYSSLFGLALMGIIFFSGFIALGAYIFSSSQSEFLKTAVEIDAKVTDISKIARKKQRNSDAGVQIYYDTILTLEFLTINGAKQIAKINDGESTVYAQGDRTTILYNPENTKEVMLPEKRGHGAILNKISSVSFAIFLVSLAFFWLLSKRKA